MNIKEVFLSQKGTFCRVVTRKELKTKKGVEKTFFAITTGTYRAGLNYENKEKTKTGRVDGTLPEENQGLPWGQWITFPYLISHKDIVYFRFYNDAPKSIITEYVDTDGTLLDESDVKPFCLATEFKILVPNAPVNIPEDRIYSINDSIREFKEAA